jgi:hypothetical protein
MYGDVEKLGCSIQGHIVQEQNIRGRNIWGCIILVPAIFSYRLRQSKVILIN